MTAPDLRVPAATFLSGLAYLPFRVPPMVNIASELRLPQALWVFGIRNGRLRAPGSPTPARISAVIFMICWRGCATRMDKTATARLCRVSWRTGWACAPVVAAELNPHRLDGLFCIGVDEIS